MRRETAPPGAPCWVDVFTSDPDRTRVFYTSLFGWQVDEPNSDFGGYFNFLKDGAPIAGGMPNDGAVPMDVWSVYLAVSDAAATVQAGTAHGAEVYVPATPIGGLGTMAVLADAGRAAIGMWQPATFGGFQQLGEPNTPSWFELLTRDYDASLAFYRDVFGWDVHVANDGPDMRYATLGQGDAMAAGIMDATGFLPEGVPAHWSVYFGCADVDTTLAAVTALGGSIIRHAEDTPYGRLAVAADPTGAVFKLSGPNQA